MNICWSLPLLLYGSKAIMRTRHLRGVHLFSLARILIELNREYQLACL